MIRGARTARRGSLEASARACPNCGATDARADGSCAFCGTAGVAPVRGSSATPPRGDPTAARFDALRAQPGFDEALRLRPSDRGITIRLLCHALIGLVFASFASFVVFGTGGGFSRAIGSVLALIGLAITTVAVLRWSRYRSAPVSAFPARIVRSRTEVTGGDNSSSTSYFVTLETATGVRREYALTGAACALLSDDDVGVAYSRDRYLLGFQRFRV